MLCGGGAVGGSEVVGACQLLGAGSFVGRVEGDDVKWDGYERANCSICVQRKETFVRMYERGITSEETPSG